MNPPEISVIVSIYNVEDYLQQCLDSLAAQTLREIEFILVDDGSTDSSGKIAKDFAEKDCRFRFIHQGNKGYAGARNAALPLANGKYIGFVDSDDFIKPEMYHTLYELAEKNHADIAGCSFEYFYQKDRIKVPYDNRAFVRLLKKNKGRLFHGAESALFDNAVTWNRIYSRDMIMKYGICFAENMKMAEDVPFFWESFVAAKKIVLTEECLYIYRNQRDGQQTSFDDERVFSFFTLFENFSDFLKRNEITGLDPWLLHMKLSRYCYGYEHLRKDLRHVYFQMVCEDFDKNSIWKDSPIAAGPGWGKYALLRFLHPLTLRAVLKKDEKKFSQIVDLRRFLGELPKKISRFLP